MGPLYKHYFPFLHLILKGRFGRDLFSLKGLQTQLEEAGEEITSSKVEKHLKGGCVERKTLKARERRAQSVCTGTFGAHHFKCLTASYQLCWMLTGRLLQHFQKYFVNNAEATKHDKNSTNT